MSIQRTSGVLVAPRVPLGLSHSMHQRIVCAVRTSLWKKNSLSSLVLSRYSVKVKGYVHLTKGVKIRREATLNTGYPLAYRWRTSPEYPSLLVTRMFYASLPPLSLLLLPLADWRCVTICRRRRHCGRCQCRYKSQSAHRARNRNWEGSKKRRRQRCGLWKEKRMVNDATHFKRHPESCTRKAGFNFLCIFLIKFKSWWFQDFTDKVVPWNWHFIKGQWTHGRHSHKVAKYLLLLLLSSFAPSIMA